MGAQVLEMAELVRLCARMRPLPNTTVARPVQSCLRGHTLHHHDSSVLMQSQFLSGCDIGMERAEQRDQHYCFDAG